MTALERRAVLAGNIGIACLTLAVGFILGVTAVVVLT